MLSQPAESKTQFDETESFSFRNRLLGWPLTAIAALLCVVLFGGWLPNYLNWPWYSDHDHFATTAQLWDAGKLPYSEVYSFQFPGEIYLFWGLGKAFGWGNTVAFYGFDAGMVLAFGALLVTWSHREFGRTAPGLIGFATFLSYYLGQNFRVVGQREWHSAFLGMVALLMPILWQKRPGRWLSGMALGAALIIRPQSIVFAPAIALAIDMSTRRLGDRWTRTAWVLIEYSVVVVGTVALGFLPLIRAGVMNDFIASLRQMGSSDSKYRMGGRLEPVKRLYRLITVVPGMIYIPLLMALLWIREAKVQRACVMTLVALPLVCLYSLLSPRDHAYFQIPVVGIVSMAMTCLVALIFRVDSRSSITSVTIILAMIAASPRLPLHNLLKTGNELNFSLNSGGISSYKDSLTSLWSHQLPRNIPSGFIDKYQWTDIRNVLIYLRHEVPQSVPVDNLIFDTLTAITSMSGHVAGMPSDNYGILLSRVWMDKTIAALKKPGPCLVVWNPQQMTSVDPAFDKIEAAVRANFEPSKKFGDIEVWSRKVQP